MRAVALLPRSLASRLALAVAVLGGAGGLVAGSTSCASTPDTERVTDVIVPDFDSYKANVDNFLRRRCGTLDCHGQPGRAYRIYGREGFRLYNEDAGLISGVQPTTDAEVIANFQAIVGLEPEEMSRLMATQGADPERLMFLRKPLRLERHKGGPAIAPGDQGYRCVVGWLRVPVIRVGEDEQGEFAEPIPPAERGRMTQSQIDDCRTAESWP